MKIRQEEMYNKRIKNENEIAFPLLFKYNALFNLDKKEKRYNALFKLRSK